MLFLRRVVGEVVEAGIVVEGGFVGGDGVFRPVVLKGALVGIVRRAPIKVSTSQART
ncbi:MAG: hypothetical protein IH859_06180 [Chloroflexi bacterium]|nr:hypothetical protein [Chloroflexota bacterium]